MKGVLVLTEGRSGSNWLVSLSNATGQLGLGGEWFSRMHIGKPRPQGKDALTQQVLKQASTPNGFFAVKVFPAHVHYVKMKYGFDLVQYFVAHHDVKLVRLTRSDRLRQAISYSRSLQTRTWTAHHTSTQSAEYDFNMVCRYFFMIGQSYAFWDSYLGMYDLESDHFAYEEMLKSPMPYLQSVASHGSVSVNEVPPSKHSIQRDSTTEEWRERFLADLKTRNIVDLSAISSPPKKHISNVIRYIAGKPMKPYPYMV